MTSTAREEIARIIRRELQGPYNVKPLMDRSLSAADAILALPSPAGEGDADGHELAGRARDLANYLGGTLMERPNYNATKLLEELADYIDAAQAAPDTRSEAQWLTDEARADEAERAARKEHTGSAMPPFRSQPMDDELKALITRSRAYVDSLTPEQHKEMVRQQGESWARAEAAWDEDPIATVYAEALSPPAVSGAGDGWKLAPVEPTEAMIEAGRAIIMSDRMPTGPRQPKGSVAIDVYTAMLAASPVPAVDGGDRQALSAGEREP